MPDALLTIIKSMSVTETMNNPTADDNQATLLIVDDTPTNLKVLFTYLQTLNFKLRVAQDGEDALEQVLYAQPDLILLDVMMPNIDGFETCRRLKDNPDTRDIPVIFMTALTDTVDKVKGFALGAVDYITKPIQQEEVLSRIKTHLMLREQQLQLNQQSRALNEANAILAQKNEKLNAFAQTLVADLHQPLKLMAGYHRMIRHCLQQSGDEQAIQYISEVEQNRHEMISTIDALLLLNEEQSDITLNPLNMAIITATAIEKSTYEINKHAGDITQPTQWPTVMGCSDWIEKVWESLIKHGLRQGGRPAKVELGAEPPRNGFVRFWMRTNGIKPSQQRQEQMILPFTQDLSQQKKTGNNDEYDLSLSAAHHVIKKCGGTMGLLTPERQGHLLYFTLPTTAIH